MTLRVGAHTGERLALVDPSVAGVSLPPDVVVVGAAGAAGATGAHIHELVVGRRWRISARSFFQCRPDGAEALATAKALRAAGWNFSVGLGQINVGNFERLGLTVESAFEPCANLAAMQTVLAECFDRASGSASKAVDQVALRRALSCYYSGNFATGFRHGYVRKIVVAARAVPTAQTKEKV